jgi:hypothetical protein
VSISKKQGVAIAAGAVLVLAIGSAVANDDSGSENTAKPRTVTETKSPSQSPRPSSPTPTPQDTATLAKATQADTFVACVKADGLPKEKLAVEHVTKVRGAEDFNDILDSADIYTDLKGGMFDSEDMATGNLIASAFSSCYKSENGLVTVYNEDGELLATGQF